MRWTEAARFFSGMLLGFCSSPGPVCPRYDFLPDDVREGLAGVDASLGELSRADTSSNSPSGNI